MGNFCARRRAVNQIDVNGLIAIEADEPWIVIPHAINQAQPNEGRHRFIKSVRRIVRLLFLRRVHSRLGSWLNTAASRQPHNASTRRIIAHMYATWPRTILRNTARIFEHLQRQRGVLVYRR